MLGAIIGDIVGSRFEYVEHKSKNFNFFDITCTFTDDTVMTVAVALAVTKINGINEEYQRKKVIVDTLLNVGQKYPHCGYGTMFNEWLFTKPIPKDSFGNGAAMRISPVGLFCDNEEKVKILSKEITEVSHNHIEAIKGAQAVALAVFLAKERWFKEDIKKRIAKDYYPELDNLTCDKIREDYYFDVTCQGSVPQALTCFFESCDYEDAIRNAVSLGGDSDTLAAICGGIAGAYYGIPLWITKKAWLYLDQDLKNYIKEIMNILSE